VEEGALTSYRASIQPHMVTKTERPRHWWEWRPLAARQVWDFESDQVARAS